MQAVEGINCLRVGRSSGVMTSYRKLWPTSSPLVSKSDVWWHVRQADGGLDRNAPRLHEYFDWPLHRRLTGEGATDVSPVKRRIANTVDGDGWKKGWMSGRKKERHCEGEVKRGRGKESWDGTEEEKIWGDSCAEMTKGNRGRRAEEWGV